MRLIVGAAVGGDTGGMGSPPLKSIVSVSSPAWPCTVTPDNSAAGTMCVVVPVGGGGGKRLAGGGVGYRTYLTSGGENVNF